MELPITKHLFVFTCICKYKCPQRPEKVVTSPEIRVRGSWELWILGVKLEFLTIEHNLLYNLPSSSGHQNTKLVRLTSGSG